MRDDLHHSLPQTSPWRAVVKVACTNGLPEQLIAAIEKAVWASGAKWWNTPWGLEFRCLLSTSQLDFFGQECLERQLDALERSSPDHSAQRFCEIARAAVMTGEPSADLLKQVTHAALEAHAEDCFEHAGARIEADHPEYQAREVRRRLLAALQDCSLSEQYTLTKKAPRQKSIEEDLRMTLQSDF